MKSLGVYFCFVQVCASSACMKKWESFVFMRKKGRKFCLREKGGASQKVYKPLGKINEKM